MSDVVRQAVEKCRSWGKWGPEDELGTLNFVTPDVIRDSAQMVRRGVSFSPAIPHERLIAAERDPRHAPAGRSTRSRSRDARPMMDRSGRTSQSHRSERSHT
jgi:hypothetical protein